MNGCRIALSKVVVASPRLPLSAGKCSFCSTSPFSSQKKEKKDQESALATTASRSREVAEKSAKGEMATKKKSWLYENSTVPININFHNKKLLPDYDPEFELKEVLEDAPKILKEQKELLRKEFSSMTGHIEKVEMLEDMGGLKNNESRVEYAFDTPESLKHWKVSADSDWKEGFSRAELLLTDKETALFRGELSSRIVKDGRVERAGWANIKHECRGDGRSYKVMLHSPLSMDMTWGDSFSHPLHTHGGPYWQYERIPFSKFFHTVAGRIQDRQYPVNLDDVSSLSISLMDRVDGPFQMEIDWIGVVKDTAHIEEFAYETYTLPLFNTHGF